MNLTQKQLSEISGLDVSSIRKAEKGGRFYNSYGMGAQAQLKFNRAFPGYRQPRPLFKRFCQKRPRNERVVLRTCAYCGSVVEKRAASEKHCRRSFCCFSHVALYRHYGPKPLDMKSTQLTGVERYAPRQRDRSKVRLDIGITKAIREARNRKETEKES